LVDGGLYANNPIGMAAVEAISLLNWQTGNFKILSIGCTEAPLDIPKHNKGRIYWAQKAQDVFLTAQSSLSSGTAILISGTENILRINPIVPKDKFKLDNTEQISSLKGLGESESRNKISNIRKFIDFSYKAEKFEPYHKF